MSDELDMLPVNKMETLDPTEAARLKPYASTSANGTVAGDQTFWEANKKYLILILAFFVLSIPFLDGLLTKLTGNSYFTLILKTILFIVIVVIVSKLYK